MLTIVDARVRRELAWPETRPLLKEQVVLHTPSVRVRHCAMVAYNFSKEVDDEMATDIGNAERFPDQTFVDFAEMVFQFLTSPRQVGTFRLSVP